MTSTLDDTDPDGWRGRLGTDLAAVAADRDEEILSAACALLTLTGPTDVEAGTV